MGFCELIHNVERKGGQDGAPLTERSSRHIARLTAPGDGFYERCGSARTK